MPASLMRPFLSLRWWPAVSRSSLGFFHTHSLTIISHFHLCTSSQHPSWQVTDETCWFIACVGIGIRLNICGLSRWEESCICYVALFPISLFKLFKQIEDLVGSQAERRVMQSCGQKSIGAYKCERGIKSP